MSLFDSVSTIAARAAKPIGEAASGSILNTGMHSAANAFGLGSVDAMNTMPKTLRQNIADGAFSFYANNLLSNPMTHVVNTMSNVGSLGLNLAGLYAAGAVDSLGAAIFREPSKGLMKEAFAHTTGLMHGIKDAINFVGASIRNKSVRAGVDATKLPYEVWQSSEEAWRLAEIDPTLFDSAWLQKGASYLKAIVNIPGQALVAEDLLFKHIAYRAAAMQGAARKAMLEANPQFAAEIMHTDFADALNVQDFAAKEATRLTFTNMPRTKWGAWLATTAYGLPGFRYVLPFRRTMLNVLHMGLEYSPAAFTGILGMPKTGAERSLMIGKVAAGTMLSAAAATILGDYISGEAPFDPLERDVWEKAGNRRYSLTLPGGGHLRLDALGPISTWIKMVADYKELALRAEFTPEAERGVTQIASEVVYSALSAISDTHWLASVADFVGAANTMIDRQNATPMMGWLARTARGFIPNPVQWTAKAIDPVRRQDDGILSTLANRIPWLSEHGVPFVGIDGREMTWSRNVNTISPGGDSPDDRWKLLTKYKIEINSFSRQAEGGRKLTREETSQLNRVLGTGGFGAWRPFLDEAEPILRDPRLPDMYKKEIVDDLLRKHKARARKFARDRGII